MGWAAMTEAERASAEEQAINAINKERGTEIEAMLTEWAHLTEAVRESEIGLVAFDDAPDTESDWSDSEFEDDEEAAKSGIPHQRDAQGHFQPDETTQSELMAIWNRNVKGFRARTDVLEKMGDPDEEPWLGMDDMSGESDSSDSEDMDEIDHEESPEE